MAAAHQWLFEPARPLVERLGPEFFRAVPAQPGVYSMRDAAGVVIYVGKAKNLRQRLGSYRVANPERVSRRHLRLMREVVRIDVEVCQNESAALIRESRLLRRLKPKFNRAGVWPGKARFLTWRFSGGTVQFSINEIPPSGWERFGPLGGFASHLQGVVARLLWLTLHPQAGFSRLPCGWAHNRFGMPVTLPCGPREAEIRRGLEQFFWGKPEEFTAWVMAAIDLTLPAFELAAMQPDLEEIGRFVASYRDASQTGGNQLALL
jgi:hypothetical protein